VSWSSAARPSPSSTRATGSADACGREDLSLLPLVEQFAADYFVSAIPASTLRAVAMEPPLPDAQRDAIAHLRYGCATRLIMQFETRFWTKLGHDSSQAGA